MVAKGIAIPIGILTSVLTARLLGPSGRGVLTILATIQGLTLQFGCLGFNGSIPYFIGKRKDQASAVASTSLVAAILIGSISALVLLAIEEFSPSILLGSIDPLFLDIFLVAIPFSFIAYFLQNILVAHQRFYDYNFIDLLLRALQLLGFASILLVFKLGLKESVEWFTFVTVLSGVIYWIRCARISDMHLKIDKSLFTIMTRYGGKTYVTSIVTFLVIRGNLFLINAWLGESQSGIYSIAVQLFDLVYILPSTLGIILFPKVSSDSSNSGELTAKVFRFSVLVIGCICLGLMIFGKELILVLFGIKFIEAVTALYWLTPGILAYSLVNILMNDLAGRGFPLVLVFAPMIGLFVQVMLNVFLMKQYGLMIPALSSTVAFIIMLIALIARFKKETGIGLSKMLFFTIEDFRTIRF